MTKHKYKRRHFLINRKFQLYYMGLVFLFCALISAALLTSFYFGFKKVIYEEFSSKTILNKLQSIDRMAGEAEMRQRYHRTKNQDIDTNKMSQEAIMLADNQQILFKDILNRILRNSSGYAFILIMIITTGTIFVTHKIAGPLYRIKMLLDKIKLGHLNIHFKLREGDKLQELAKTLDDLFKTYRHNIKEIVTTVNEINVKCNGLLEKTTNAQVKTDIEQIKNKHNTIISICHRFSHDEPEAIDKC